MRLYGEYLTPSSFETIADSDGEITNIGTNIKEYSIISNKTIKDAEILGLPNPAIDNGRGATQITCINKYRALIL